MYPVKDVRISAEFGVPGSWAAGKHTGTDFAIPVGTPVHATKGGRVVFSGWGGYGSAYGLHVIVSVRTRTGRERRVLYAHLSSSAVRQGERIKFGDLIGKSGNTGRSTGPHLHYEERVAPFGYFNYAKPVFLKYKPVVRPRVRLSNLRPGKKNRDVRKVKKALNRRFRKNPLPTNKYFGAGLRDRYKQWQERLGYEGRDANGIPGKFSLEKLGFRVKP